MSQENIDKRDPNLMEYKNLLKELLNENESLKMRIVELEEEIKILLGPQEPIKEISIPKIQPMSVPTKLEQEVIVSNSDSLQDIVQLEMGKGPIVEGISRRECPICGNTNKALIYENIDRTHMISFYPKLYGKKYKCGQCGREWRIPPEI